MTDLKEVATRLRKLMADAACGPLIAAAEVLELSDRWDETETVAAPAKGSAAPQASVGSLREQAGGLTCDGWLKDTGIAPGGLHFYRERQRAVEALGEASRRTINHAVAVYIYRSVPEQYRDAVKLEMMRGAREQKGNPLTLSQARKRIQKIVGHVPRVTKPCNGCLELEAKLKEAENRIAELSAARH